MVQGRAFQTGAAPVKAACAWRLRNGSVIMARIEEVREQEKL